MIYLWVVHEPHQASQLCVQDEVAAQELAAAFILLNVQEATDAVLSVHVRHLAAGTFPGLLGPGVLLSKGKSEGGEKFFFLKDRSKRVWRETEYETVFQTVSVPPGLHSAAACTRTCDTNHNPAFTLLY